MVSLTPNYGLVKPDERTDFIDIDQINSNMDTIDTQLKNLSDRVVLEKARTNKLIANAFDGGDLGVAANFNTSPTNAITHDGSRCYLITTRWDARPSSGIVSGHMVVHQFSLNAGAWTDLSWGHYGCYVNAPIFESRYFESWWALTTPGSLRIRCRCSCTGGATTNAFYNCQVNVYDAGAYSPGTWVP